MTTQTADELAKRKELMKTTKPYWVFVKRYLVHSENRGEHYANKI